MWLLIIALMLVVLLALLLFTPLRISVDTFFGTAALRWGWWGATVLATTDGDLRYRMRLPFYTAEGSLFDLEWPQANGTGAKSATRKRPGKWTADAGLPLRVLCSFKVRRLRWYLDTGDPLWNAWLFPAFHLLHVRGHDVRIAFDGRSGLLLVLENNLYRLLRAAAFKPHTQHPQQHEQGHQ